MLGVKHLDLHGTTIKELSFAKVVCANLQHLNVRYCCGLVEVGALPTTLMSLNLKGCIALKKVTGLCGLAKIQELDIRKCEAMEELPFLETLISLAHIQVSGCRMLKTISGLAQATNLRIPSLDDIDSDWIEKILFLDMRLCKEGLHGLLEGDHFLSWEHGLQVEGEDLFSQGNELQGSEWPLEGEDVFRWGNEFPVEGEDTFRQGNGMKLANLANLQHLNLIGCKNLQMLSFLGNLTNLQYRVLPSGNAPTFLREFNSTKTSLFGGMPSVGYLDQNTWKYQHT